LTLDGGGQAGANAVGNPDDVPNTIKPFSSTKKKKKTIKETCAHWQHESITGKHLAGMLSMPEHGLRTYPTATKGL
jgi:hypothetical protein